MILFAILGTAFYYELVIAEVIALRVISMR